MKLHALLLLSLVFLLGADEAPSDALKKDLARFQGSWTVASMEMDGKFMSPEDRKKIKLTLNGENFVFKNGPKSEPGLYKLDPTKNPKELNIVITEGDDKGKVYLVIYKVEGDTMTQCMRLDNKSRPGEFIGKAGSGCALEIWQREK